jgi:osmoprotectant transport system permease protein
VPTIMAGVRTAAVNIIATVALASLAGLSTLGDFILGRNVYGDAGVVAGAIVIALLTLILEFSLAGLQWMLTPRGLKLARAGAAA